MTLSTQLWSENSDLASEALTHPFVCRLGDGSLAREISTGYLAQDAFFLESFARAYALALAHSPDTPLGILFSADQNTVAQGWSELIAGQ